jgi:hypothetical protein
MARPSSSVAQKVTARAKSLSALLRKMDELRKDGRISELDLERVYGATALEFHAFIERSIEELFLGLLRERLTSSDGSIKPLVSVPSDRTARAIVQGGRAYVDWLPYNFYTMPRAKAYFASGKPFSRLEKSDVDALADFSLIRNALAHQSNSAIRSFQKGLVEGKNLPISEHRPAAYLRGTHTLGQSRMNHLLARLAAVMNKLCS